MKVSIKLQKKPLYELVEVRKRLQEELMQVDADILASLKKPAAEYFRPVTSDIVSASIDENRGSLSISELVDAAGVSLQTYYNAKERVDIVSVGKLKRLLQAIGLQLYIGKRQGN